MQHTTQLLTPKQAAEWIGVTTRFLEARRYRGTGPSYIYISARCIRYRPEDLEEWARKLLVSHDPKEPEGQS